MFNIQFYQHQTLVALPQEVDSPSTAHQQLSILVSVVGELWVTGGLEWKYVLATTTNYRSKYKEVPHSSSYQLSASSPLLDLDSHYCMISQH